MTNPERISDERLREMIAMFERDDNSAHRMIHGSWLKLAAAGLTELLARRSPPAQEGMVLDAPAREGGGEWEALQAVVSAWEATKAGDTTVPEIQRWLIEDMKPAIDAARRILASPAEPAAHSLQTEPSAKLAWAIQAADGHLKRATMDYDSRDEIISVLLTEVRRAMLAASPAPSVSEPVPYAWEFGRSNGDDTYSVVIERGRERPKDAHPDWPPKPLYAAQP